MIVWPDSLIRDIARRNVVLYIGAGVSRQSTNATGAHPPLWGEFLKSAAEKLEIKARKKEVLSLLKSNDYLTACELLKAELGEAEYLAECRAAFLTPGYQHAQIHDVISEIDSRFVLTPNVDKIYDTRVNTLQHNTVPIKSYHENDILDNIRSSSRIVLKIHGTIDSPGQMVFTRQEYANARVKHRDFYRILESLVSLYTFVFIGCGINDPDIRLILEDYRVMTGGVVPHYLVTQKGLSAGRKSLIESNSGVKLLLYDPINNHKELADSLISLRDFVQAKREEIAELLDW